MQKKELQKKPNILIVDDIPDNLFLLQVILKSLDVNLIFAESAAMALKKIKNKEIMLALIDLQMPEMDGIDLVYMIQGDKGREKVPIILITAYNKREKEIEQYYETGIVDFILKPINSKILLSKVRVFLELYRQKQDILEQRVRLKMLTNELEVHQKKLLAQNEELATAVLTAESISCQFENLYDFAPTGYFTLDKEGCIHKVNLTGAKMLKKDRTSLIGTNFSLFVTDETRTIYNNFIEFITKNNTNQYCEVKLSNALIGTIDVILEGVNAEFEDKYLISAIDITQPKLAKEALRISENQYRSIFENMLNGFAYCHMHFDEQNKPYDFTYINVNKAFESQTGLHDVIGKRVTEVIPGIEKTDQALFEFYGRIASGGKPESIEYYLESLQMWLSISVYCPRIGYFVAIFDVITNRIIEENNLRRMQKQLELAQQSARAGFWDWDIISEKIEWTSQLFRLFGLEPNQAEASMDIWNQVLHPEDIKQAQERLNDSIQSKTRLMNEYRVVMPDGEIKWIRAQGEPFYSSDGLPVRMTGICIDITDQMIKDKAMRESEENFRTFFETIGDLVFVTDKNCKILYVNQALIEKLDYTINELTSMHLLDMHPKEVQKDAESILDKMLQGQPETCNLPLLAKNGNQIPVESRIWFGKWNGNECIFGISKDLTNIQEAQQRFEILFRNNPTPLALSNIQDLNFTDVNESFLKTLGYTEEEIIGKNPAEIGLFNNIDELFRAAEKLKSEGHISGVEMQIIEKNGGIIRGLFSGEVISINNQKFLLTAMINITKRIIAEEALKNSEKMLSNIIEHLPLMLFVKDAGNLRFVRINKAGEELLGHSREDMIGKTDYDFFPEEQAKHFISDDMQVLKSKKLKIAPEEKILTRYNEERILQTKKIPIFNNEGEPEYLLGISEDITVIKQTETALVESEKMYRTLLNASPEGIIIMDLKGEITEISNITLEIFGTDNKQDFLGKQLSDFLPEEEQKKLKDILVRTQLEGLVQNCEFVLTRKNQFQFICELSTTLIQETDGKPKAYMAIIRDISQRKKMEQQLIRTERMVSLGEMASGMAHEINQPLLSISLGIENMFLKIKQSNLIDENYFNRKSEKIFEDIQRIGYIIDHVRAFSRDHDEFIVSTFNLNDSIKNAVSMISQQFKHYGIKLIIKLDKGIEPINGNTYKLEQVILNLLNNAKDALEEKAKIVKIDIDKTIKIRTFFTTHNYFIEVEDNGIGIKNEDIDKILFPFYTTKEVGKGTGLGLSISFGIIKELNGNIEIESKPLAGSTFKISIPRTELIAKQNIENQISENHE